MKYFSKTLILFASVVVFSCAGNKTEKTEDVARLAARHSSAQRVLEDNRKIQINSDAEAEKADAQEAEAEATAKFEQHVTNTICMGAKDRATALRWIMDASQADGDWEYFCFLNGLPYGYFKEMEVA